jgi:hypothetical protein
MLLDANKIPELQRLLDSAQPDTFEKLRGAEVTLTVALFLALAHRSASDAGKADLARKIAHLCLPGVQRAIMCLENSGEQISREPFGSPDLDLYKIGSKQDLLSDEWSLFYDRFRRSAANGRRGTMFRGVGGVLGEMGDNVVWHAFETENKPCLAIAGFYITDDTASFCVADCGQGFLRSLRRSPIWAPLSSDNEALDAVVNKHATSRIGEKEGGGFKQLFNALLDFNGLVILRSGSCAYWLENRGATRHLTVRQSVHVTGSHVTVAISTGGQPLEIPLKESS